MQKLKRIYILLLSVILILGCSFSSYADLRDLMIGSSSNALMTLELDDSDYLMIPRSSIGSVENTVVWEYPVYMFIHIMNDTDKTLTSVQLDSNSYTAGLNGIRVHYTPPSGHSVYGYTVWFRQQATDFLPMSGIYNMSLDISSQFSMKYKSCSFWGRKDYSNANSLDSNIYPSYEQLSGDLYIAPFLIRVTNTNFFNFKFELSENVKNVDFTLKVRFERASGETSITTGGTINTTQDYENDVSSSLSDLSSSVDSMTEDLSSAAENLEYISTSQNLIIQGIDNVVMHISDQLFAFWNQLFNLIHVPTMAKMDDIISAINNMDLEIEVNLDGLKTTINNMSTAVQNKLQSTTDQITGGYDNSGIVSDQTELDSALNEYQQAEDELFDDAKEHLNNFEFDTPLDQFIKPIQDISYFMTGIFNGLAGLNIPIQFSLTLTIALILIGYYRIKR